MQSKTAVYCERKDSSNMSDKPIQRLAPKKAPIVQQSSLMEIIQRARMNPSSLTHYDAMQLQKTIGNQAVVQLLSKLHINQKVTNAEDKPTQLKTDQSSVERKTSMPAQLKAGLETLSNIDLSDVQVHHNSHKPKEVGALAYTQGNDIHIAPGQEKHLPHEGWHAVQQKQGRVKPTLQMKTGVQVNDDSELEKEADVMGSKAAQGSTVQLKYGRNVAMQHIKVIQKVAENADIKQASYGETSENVSKIQSVLMQMHYWTGSSSDKPTGYFGPVTRDSLMNYQTGYMRLSTKDLYDNSGNYVGCGPKTAKSLNNFYKLLNRNDVPDYAKNSMKAIGQSDTHNSAYNWKIKEGVYNANVQKAQENLITLGYKLNKFGADGKWSSKGETYQALIKFQSMCKEIYNIISKYGGATSRKQVDHFQGVEPSGKLDKITYKALQEQVNRKLSGYKTAILEVKNQASKKGNVTESTGNYNVMNEFGDVHDQVQKKAADKYQLAMEYQIKGGGLKPDGKTSGWADLVDTKTYEVWEIKNDTPDWNEINGIGRKQLERYINASKKYGNVSLKRGSPRIKVDPFKSTVFGKPATVTVRSGLGAFNDLENGMIYYKVKYDKEKDPKDIPITFDKTNRNNNSKDENRDSNVIQFPTPSSEKDKQVAASSSSDRAWWEIPAGIGLVIIGGAATFILAADDATGIGALDDPAMAATGGMVLKGARMIFAW